MQEKFLRAIRLLTMVVWVGGLIFFAFVGAPVAFRSLPSTHLAGLVVGGSLNMLHWIGIVSGLLFYLCTAILWFRAEVPARVGFAVEMTLTGIMLAVTAYSQFRIIPAMERDRIEAGGAIELVAPDAPARADFNHLHVLSERLEGLVLLCGIGVVLFLARESQWPETGRIKQL